jgi:hypothetical protein
MEPLANIIEDIFREVLKILPHINDDIPTLYTSDFGSLTSDNLLLFILGLFHLFFLKRLVFFHTPNPNHGPLQVRPASDLYSPHITTASLRQGRDTSFRAISSKGQKMYGM